MGESEVIKPVGKRVPLLPRWEKSQPTFFRREKGKSVLSNTSPIRETQGGRPMDPRRLIVASHTNPDGSDESLRSDRISQGETESSALDALCHDPPVDLYFATCDMRRWTIEAHSVTTGTSTPARRRMVTSQARALGFAQGVGLSLLTL